MMSCHAACHLIQTALDGRLTVSDQERLDAHLADCPACREAQAGLRRVDESLQWAVLSDRTQAPPELMTRLGLKKPVPAQSRRLPWIAAAAVAAAFWLGTQVHQVEPVLTQEPACVCVGVGTHRGRWQSGIDPIDGSQGSVISSTSLSPQ